MKKRFLPALLALVLCAGLAVPALAATSQLEGYAKHPQYKLTINHPDNYTIPYKEDTYRIREINFDDQHNGEPLVYNYDEVKVVPPEEIPTGKMPLVPGCAEILVSGLNSENGVPIDTVRIMAYSDPDGDGIYDRRLVINDTSVLPLKGSYDLSDAAKFKRGDSICADALGFNAQPDESGYMSVTMSTDRLCQIFGANTIFCIEIDEEISEVPVIRREVKEIFLFLLTGETAPPAAPSFTDVPEWCAPAVNWAVDRGITKGVGNNRFAPNTNCTHAQILTFLWRYIYLRQDQDYTPALNWAREKGLIDDSFDPNAPCTRAQAVNYIWQVFGKESAAVSSFNDVPAGADYAAAVNWAVATGITEGTGGGNFSPDKVCNRGTIVTLLHRAYVPSVRLK